MLIVTCVAGAAALVVVAYQRLQCRSPEIASAGRPGVHELAAIVLVLVKAVEGVIDVLGGGRPIQAEPTRSSWGGYREFDFDEDER